MASNTAPIRIAAIQMCSTADRDRNLSVAGGLIARAADAGIDLVALPENFSFLGDGEEKLNAAESPDDGPSLRFLQDQARRYGIAIVGGSVSILISDGKISNTCFALRADGEVVARYDKIHLFDVAIDDLNTYRESEFVAPGNEVVTADLCGARMGLSICYDVRFPELYRSLSRAGARVLFVPAAFTVETGKAHWEILLRARAIENQCYVVAPAQYGWHSDLRVTFGHTMIIDPWGRVLGSAEDGDAVVVAGMDMEVLRDVRTRLPALRHVRLSADSSSEAPLEEQPRS